MQQLKTKSLSRMDRSKRTMRGAEAHSVVYRRFRSIVALGLACLFCAAQGAAVAQQADDNAKGQAAAATENSGETVRVLFLLQRPTGTALRRDDPMIQLSSTLREALGASNHYEIILYSPEQPSVKRALLEHTIPVSDLVEPIKPDALQRVARAIGARYAMTLHPTIDKQGIKATLRYDEDLNGETWRNALSEQFSFDAVSGKHHLKTADLIAMTVDAICVRLGVPSHLAAKIDIGPTKIAGAAPTVKTKQTTHQTAPAKSDSATQVAQNTADGSGSAPPGTAANSTSPSNTANGAAGGGTATKQDSPAKTTRKSVDNAVVAADQDAGTPVTQPAVTRQKTTQRPGKTAQALHTAAPSTPQAAILTAAPSRPDYAAQAQRERQAGDMSSTIVMLRRAVTAAPRDPALRRQLIQAYEDRRLPDAALAEAERALQLIPADNTLKRLHGDALLSKGDTPGALKIYHEIVQSDPADVTAQVALADALLKDNQYTEALSAYEAAAKTDPNSPLPHRRLARVYAGRAAADPAQYRLSLNQLELARQLNPSSDPEVYRQDYTALMQQMEQRLRDMADELQNSYQATIQGRTSVTEVTRSMADLKERANALSDYLDQVSPAAGQDGAHKHYSLGAALLIQAIDTFRKVLANSNARIEDAQGPLRSARVDTLHELSIANKMLLTTQTEVHTGSPNSVSLGGARLPTATP